ncbi:MAG: DUF3592 domain-containing protein [Bacteroidota bacterium]
MNIDPNYILLLVGVVFLGVGLYQWIRSINLSKRGIKIEGTIYDLVTRTVGEDDVERTFLTVKFTTLDDQKVIKDTDIIAPNGAKYTKADTVNVVYDPSDPENCIIYQEEKMPYNFLIYMAIGAIIILLALIAFHTEVDLFSDD